jgi:protein arginine kinase activator
MSMQPEDQQPSLCQSCGQRPAVVEFVQINGSARREVALCRECAMTQGVGGQLEVFQRLAQLLMHQFRPVSQAPAEWQEAMASTCGRCGMAFEQFVHTGLLGCPQCYEDFRELLTPILRRLHGVIRQAGDGGVAGTNPTDQTTRSESGVRRAELEAELKHALVEENFELAARIRDELRRL